MRCACIFLLSLALTNSAFSEDEQLDSASQDALRDTKAMLNDRVAREKASQENANTMKAAQNVNSLGLNAEGNDAIYKISGEILEKMARDSKGDPEKMTVRALEMMKDPELIEQTLTDENRAKIRSLASEIEDKKGNKAPPTTSQ